MHLTRRTFSAGLGSALGALTATRAALGQEKGKGRSGGLPTIKMQASWINDAEFLGYYVALDPQTPFFERAGVKVEYFPGGPAIVPETSLLSRKTDIALTTPETTAQYILRDKIDFRIIGAQYQKNPIGIVSLAQAGIKTPADLKGKKLAVPPVNRLTVEAVLKINGIDPKQVELVPYTYDPRILLSGAADASTDFTTNVPYAIKKLGAEPYSFLLYDVGLTLYNDIVVVRKEVLESKFDALVAWMVGAIQGWEENYKDQTFEKYPRKYQNTYFKNNGRTVENEIEFNRNQYPLIKGDVSSFFEMTAAGIRGNIRALDVLNLALPSDVFDTRVVEAALAKLKR